MSPSVEPFNEAKYKALMDGLECNEILYSSICSTITLRYDSEYYKKEYIAIEKYIKTNLSNFTTLSKMGLSADASAFYPALEPFYNSGSIPFIRVADVKNSIDYENCIRIPQMGKEFNTLNLCHLGDIVLTKGGRVGTAGLITQDSYVTRDLIFINSSKLKREDYVALYLYYCSDFAQKQMIRSSSMTAQPHLTITLVKGIHIYSFSDLFKNTIVKVFNDYETFLNKSVQEYNVAAELLGKCMCLPSPVMLTSYTKHFSDSFAVSGRLDAEYYQPKYDEYLKALHDFETTSLPTEYDVFKNSGTNYANGVSDVGVIKTKQIGNNGIDSDGVESYFTIQTCIENKNTFLKNNDIVFASMGVGSLGKISLFSYDGDERFVTDSTLRIYRAKPTCRVQPEVVCLFLQSWIGQELIYRYVVGSTGIINIYDGDMAKIPIPVLDDKVQKEIATKVQDSLALRKKSKQLLEYAKQAVEMAIEQGEDVALEWLKQKMQKEV